MKPTSACFKHIVLLLAYTVVLSKIYSFDMQDVLIRDDATSLSLMLKNNPKLTDIKIDKLKPITYAVSRKSLLALSVLTQFDNNINDNVNVPGLHMACSIDYIEGVCLLLSAGADPNHESKNFGFPLKYAAAVGSIKCCAILLAHGAKINAISEVGHCSAIQIAINNGHLHLAQFLKEQGADLSLQEQFAVSDKIQLELLLKLNHGFNINSTDSYHMAPIHYAVSTGNINAIEFLLSLNANIHRTSRLDSTLTLALKNNKIEVAKLLINKGAKLNTLTINELKDCFMRLLQKGDHESISIFIKQIKIENLNDIFYKKLSELGSEHLSNIIDKLLDMHINN